MLTILVTGATGFVGNAFVKKALSLGNDVRVVVRDSSSFSFDSLQCFSVQDISKDTNWDGAFVGVDVIVHCAARAHLMRDISSSPLSAYREINVAGALNLAKQAAEAGVRRFVFISSIKVNGESTLPERPFVADDFPAPLDPYGVSKMEAEHGLRIIAAKTKMKLVIVRPPLIYGPGVRANFATLLRWVSYGVPMPFGAIHNARSIVSLDNLLDLLMICLWHPAAVGQTFLVSDGDDVSTTELLRRTAKAMGKKIFLLPVPVSYLEFGASLLGKYSVAHRLFSSLQVDIQKTRHLLGWDPPLTLDEGLKRVVDGMKQ